MDPLRHWSTSRKFLAFVFVAVLLIVGALAVKPANFGALSLALVALYGSFAASNTVAGIVGNKAPAPPEQP